MATVPVVTGNNVNSLAVNVTRGFPLAVGNLNVAGSEAQEKITYRFACTLSKLYVRVTANTVSAASTLRTRKNLANGAQSVSITSNTSGVFQDTTNSDTVVATDVMAYQLTTGATGTSITVSLIACLCAATTNTSIRFGVFISTSYSQTSSTVYHVPVGLISTSSVEANAKERFNFACTIQNLYVNSTANTRSTASTVKSRKNGADGGLSVSIGATTTGIFEDTTNSDSLSAGDDFNWAVVLGSDANTLTLQAISGQLLNSTDSRVLLGAGSASAAQNSALTKYLTLGGQMSNSATESDFQVDLQEDVVLNALASLVRSNTLNGSTTIGVRKNAGPGNLTVSIGATSTGLFQDSTDVDSIVSGDLVNYSWVTGGSSGSIGVSFIAVSAAGQTFADSNTLSLALTPSATETAQYTEQPTGTLSLTPSTTETAQYVEGATGALALTPSVVEAAGLVDSDTCRLSLTVSTTDTEQAVDSDTEQLSLTPSSTETADLVDQNTEYLALAPITVQEGIEHSDSETDSFALTPSAADVADYVDSAIEALSLTPASSDTADYIDASTELLALTPSALEERDYYDSDTASLSLTAGQTLEQHYLDVEYVASSFSSATDPTTGDFILPAGWQPGDVAIFWWYSRDPDINGTGTIDGSSTGGLSRSFTKPSGITRKAAGANGSAPDRGLLFLGYRTLTPGDTTFTWLSSQTTTDVPSVGNDCIWGVDVYRNVKQTGDPFEAAASLAALDNVNDPDPTSVNGTSKGAFIYAGFWKNNTFTTISPSAGYNLRGNNNGPNNASYGTEDKLSAGGTQDPGVITLGGGAAGDDGFTFTGSLVPVVESRVDTGTQTLSLTPTSTDKAAYVESATERLGLSPSSTDVKEATDQATTLFALTPTADNTAQFVDADVNVLALSIVSVEVSELADQETALLAVQPSSLDELISVDSDVEFLALTPTSQDTTDYVDSDTLSLNLNISQVEATNTYDAETAQLLLFPTTSEDIAQFVDADTAGVGLSPSQEEAKEALDTDTASLVFSVSFSEVQISVDSAITTLALSPTTVDSLATQDQLTSRLGLTPLTSERAAFMDTELNQLLLNPSVVEVQVPVDANVIELGLAPTSIDTSQFTDAAVNYLLLTPTTPVEGLEARDADFAVIALTPDAIETLLLARPALLTLTPYAIEIYRLVDLVGNAYLRWPVTVSGRWLASRIGRWYSRLASFDRWLNTTWVRW